MLRHLIATGKWCLFDRFEWWLSVRWTKNAQRNALKLANSVKESRQKVKLRETLLGYLLNASQIRGEFKTNSIINVHVNGESWAHSIELTSVSEAKLNENDYKYEISIRMTPAKGKQMNVRHRQTIPLALFQCASVLVATTFSAQRRQFPMHCAETELCDIVRLICFCRLGHILSEVYLGWLEFASHDQHS